jgi:rare lipoprotein A (peptidoglycan hydrolase)
MRTFLASAFLVFGLPWSIEPAGEPAVVVPYETGQASWYGEGFDGRLSASGEIFNMRGLTAAHRRLPFGTAVRVTNLANGRSVVVRINDRGPQPPSRVIDLSFAAARHLRIVRPGRARVRLDVLEDETLAGLATRFPLWPRHNAELAARLPAEPPTTRTD